MGTGNAGVYKWREVLKAVEYPKNAKRWPLAKAAAQVPMVPKLGKNAG